ncbi:taste receptor type 2 member 1 [Saccopteryx leptura]|uniref:taste receptor type 2 member 1 n=1 Tax=Saccopteryx leptura TaxID=249018 RepID=UPI00339BC74A
MLESEVITHFIFAVIQFLMGVLANGIIVVVNSIGLIKQKKMLPVDLLLCCLATSRICLQIIIFYIHLIVISWIEFSRFVENSTVFTFAHKLELWFATWLSVFYCAKIATIAHPLIFWLKLRISKLVPWLIFGSLLYTSLTSVFNSKQAWIFSQKFLLGLFFQNATTPINEISVLQFAFFVIDKLLPFLIFLISSLLLIFSLGRHTRQMMSTATGTRNSRTTVHVTVLLSILSFLVLYLTQYTMSLLVLSQTFKVRNFFFLFCILVLGSYPSVHSVILVLGNPKLKQNVKKFLLHSKCCQ